MNKVILGIVGGMLVSLNTYAQDWLGNITENHAGVLEMHVQPASLISSPYKFDINILGANFVGYNVSVLESLNSFNILNPNGFVENEKEFMIRAALQFPSFTWKIDEKNAVGFEFKMRPVWYTGDSDGNVIKTLFENLEDDELNGIDFTDQFLTSKAHWWTDIAATYSRRIWKNPQHRVDGGITLKLIQGNMSGYLNMEDLSFVMANSDTIESISGTMQFVYNSELDALSEGERFSLFSTTTAGLSFGFEYGFAPDGLNEKLRLGISVLDIGRVKYGRSNQGGEFVIEGSDIPLDPFRKAESLGELADVAREQFDEINVTDEDFFVTLPSKLAILADYNISRHWYINFSSYIALRGNNRDVLQTRNFDNFLLTPRIEKEKWGLQVPLGYNSIEGFITGLGARWGPLYIGSSNIFRILFVDGGDTSKFSAFMGFRFSRLDTWQKKNKKSR